MIRQNWSNNVEFQRIKMNNLFGLDRKSGFKTNNYLLKSANNMKKWLKNYKKCPKMATIRQYWTLFDII